MKRTTLLFVFAIALFYSCVSVNPATGNYPITGDVLQAFVNGVPYEFIDERQYYRSLLKDSHGVEGLWFDVDKKGNWKVLYNVEVPTDGTTFSDQSPPTPTAKFARLPSISYVERPFRRN